MGSRQVDSCKKTKDSLTRKKKEEEEVIWAFPVEKQHKMFVYIWYNIFFI